MISRIKFGIEHVQALFAVTVYATACIGVVLGSSDALARDQIRIVGSSTVYPFSATVAEVFGKTSTFKTPVVESTGSGGGFKLFCSGVGETFPDITNASRAIKSSEIKTCKKNGVKDVTEVKIGYDGIVIANSKRARQFNLTREQLFLALARQVPAGKGRLVPNPNKTWNDIDPSLPAIKIEVMGPPPTSGTRDAFSELVLEVGCKKTDWIKKLKKTDKKRYKAICHGIREDGAWIEAGENDMLIISKLTANPNSLGVFGFSFLEQNEDRVQGSIIEGIVPTFDSIADGTYTVSRPLFFYIKGAHVGIIPGIKEYITEFTAEKTWGDDGYLSDKSLIPMPKKERNRYQRQARSLSNNIGS